MDLARKTARNSAFSLVGFVWPVVLAIVATPIIVRELGTEHYGILALTISFVGVLAVLDLGLSPALLHYASDARARHDVHGVNSAVGMSLIFYFVVGLLGGLTAVLVGTFLLNDLIPLSVDSRSLARTAFYLAGAGFMLSVLLAALAALPGAFQRIDASTKLNLGLTTAATLIIITIVEAGLGVRSILIANILLALAGICAFFLLDKHIFPAFRPDFGWDWRLFRRVGHFGVYTLIGTVGGAVLFQLDKFVVGHYLGATAVTYYAVPGNLSARVHGAAAGLALIVFPVTTHLFALRDETKLHRMYERATRIIDSFVLAITVPLVIFSGKVLEIWLGPDFASRSTTVMMILTVTYAVLALNVVPFYVALGAGRPRITAAFQLAWAVTNVTLVFVLVPPLGLVGAAVAYLGSLVSVPLFVYLVETRVLGLSGGVWCAALFRMMPAVIVQIGVGLLLLPLVAGLVTLLLALTVTVLAFPIALLVSGQAAEEDVTLVKWLLRNGLRGR